MTAKTGESSDERGAGGDDVEGALGRGAIGACGRPVAAHAHHRHLEEPDEQPRGVQRADQPAVTYTSRRGAAAR